MGKNQHVTPHNGGWQVKAEGNQRATKTQAKAIQIARANAIKQHSELFIHGKNNQIREKNSYGNDPYPPKSPWRTPTRLEQDN